MNVRMEPYPELNRKAFRVLCREIGVVDTLRFLGQLWAGPGDYTEARRKLFGGLTLDEYRRAVGRPGNDSA